MNGNETEANRIRPNAESVSVAVNDVERSVAQKRHRRPLPGRLLIASLSVFVALVVCEGLLRVFWHNPYRFEEPERLLRLPLHHARSDYVVDRSLIDSQQPVVRFRTDDRSYILPNRQYETPDATVAFVGRSTTECFAVQ